MLDRLHGSSPRRTRSDANLTHTLRPYNALKIRFFATLGEEPEIEVGLL